jgi:hypothetical protein
MKHIRSAYSFRPADLAKLFLQQKENEAQAVT